MRRATTGVRRPTLKRPTSDDRRPTLFRDAPKLEDLPNIGPSVAGDLRLIGIHKPADLYGKDPYRLYEALNKARRVRQDPCVLDVFIAAVRYIEGDPARPWYAYTAERKRTLKPAASVAGRRSSVASPARAGKR